MADMKLVYPDVRGRVEPLRLVLYASGKKFEDYRFPTSQFADEKAKAPYGQLPYLVCKGKKYGESKALATFLARECGMYGKTNEEGLRVDEVYCLVGTLFEDMVKAFFEKDEAKKAEMDKKLADETIPRFMGYFEKLLKENGSNGFFVGSALTLADMALYDIIDSILKRVPTVLDKCPEAKKVRQNVEANASVKAYLAKRPAP